MSFLLETKMMEKKNVLFFSFLVSSPKGKFVIGKGG
jgi:hypothetical protein